MMAKITEISKSLVINIKIVNVIIVMALSIIVSHVAPFIVLISPSFFIFPMSDSPDAPMRAFLMMWLAGLYGLIYSNILIDIYVSPFFSSIREYQLEAIYSLLALLKIDNSKLRQQLMDQLQVKFLKFP